MEIFTNHKVEWLIGICSAFIPTILGWFIKKTANIPDITIPFWLLCLLISLPIAYLLAKKYSLKTKDIANKSYGVERIFT